jgi:hypothetical protein
MKKGAGDGQRTYRPAYAVRHRSLERKGEMKILGFEARFVAFIPSECHVRVGWWFGWPESQNGLRYFV